MVKTIDHFMDAAAARAGEEIVAAQWFYPQDRWKNPMTVMRLVRASSADGASMIASR